MSECPFCRIARGEARADVVHEDDDVIAFRDIRPQAPVHVLIVPRRHVESLADAAEGDGPLLGKILLAASEIARREGIDARGYRIVTNRGREAGQTVLHLHFHLLGGRAMGWPPG